MKISFSLLLVLCVTFCDLQAQLRPGFLPAEARDMAALCTMHTFDDLYGSHESIIPEGYEHIYSSVPTPLDNKFEIFQKDDLAILEIRGTTAEMMSWMVNVYSSLIPAKGNLSINGEIFNYNFSNDTAAAVHAGYTLALATIAPKVVEQLIELNNDNIHDVIITGHSQGGALAHLMRAFLENLAPDVLPSEINFKTYALAAPMVGNKAFALDYAQNFCTNLSSFSIINSADFVPNMPISFSEGNPFAVNNLIGAFFAEDENVKSVAISSLMNMFSGSLENISSYASTSVEKRMNEALGEVQMPAFKSSWNYHPMEEIIELPPFDYPLILNDSTILQNDSIMNAEPRDANGEFENRSLYRKTPGSFHHKPYNYYIAIQKRYFPLAYKAIEVKILPENL